MTRQCGDCQLCCKLLPVRELGKGANTRCTHQRFRKGCAIYPQRPVPCRIWNCRWLGNDNADDLRRPDIAGYVIDIMPDYVRIQNPDGSEQRVEVVQIWVDPKRPDAYRDPELLAWLERKAEQCVLALIRFDSKRAVVLGAPSITGKGWIEVDGNLEPQHSVADVFQTLGGI